MKKYKYHYFYEIVNNLNGCFYYGIHSTNDINDGYMGSGRRLHLAYKQYGVENFSKNILKYFDSRKKLVEYESLVVSENLVKDNRCYNVALGGESFCCLGSFTSFDKKFGIWRRITVDEYNSEPNNFIKSPGVGYVIVIDSEQNHVRITKDEYLANKEKYKVINAYETGKIIVSLKSNPDKQFIIDKNDFDETIHNRSKTEIKPGMICVRDSNNNCFFVDKNDQRYLSGELKHVSIGYKFTDDQKQTLKNKFKLIGHQQGEKNSQYGTRWVNKDGQVIKIKKHEVDEYLSNGWNLGMKAK